MKGRKPKPNYLKVVSGTAQPSRMNDDAPTPSESIPDPPHWLSPRAAEWFQKITGIMVGQKTISADFVDVLSLAATRYDEILDCTAVIEDCGRVYVRKDTEGKIIMVKARPEVAMRSEALRHLHSLLSELGLSPAAIGKVKGTGGRGSEDDPFSEFG